ncbi:MAG: hypothetical protein IPK26_28510 [Planctomycetes bacterium]|nr:hypothetical protein [Planctomycetota bacterium]
MRLTVVASPQGPLPIETVVTPQLPAQPSLLSHAPFASVGRLRAAGTIDLDGNDLPDAWFLGDAPGHAEHWALMDANSAPAASGLAARVFAADSDRGRSDIRIAASYRTSC